MANLNMLNAWSGNTGFFGVRSAQGYLNGNSSFAVSGSCGSACGAGDEKPDSSGCGSACGAGDK